MKKLTSLLLSLVMVVTMSVMILPVEEVHASETEGFFKVWFNDRDKTCEIVKYNGDELNVVIPDTLRGYKVVSVDGFDNKQFMQTVKLPKYLKTIDSGAFSRCQNLQSVTIPSGVETVRGFQECPNLKSVVIKSGVKAIDSYAFYKCTSLSSVVIPDTVKSIGTRAFEGTLSLKSIKLPSKLEKMTGIPFIKSGVTEIIIPDSVTSIDFLAESCPNLTKVSFGKGLTECKGVYRCPSLTTLDFSRAVNCTLIDYFEGNTALTSVKLPVNLEKIDGHCFSGCKNLQNVEISEGLRVMGNYAFNDCNLSSIHLPKTFQGFWSLSLSGNKNLKRIICDGTIIDKNAVFQYKPNWPVVFEVYDNSEFLSYYNNSKNGSDKITFDVKPAIQSTDLKLSASSVVLWEGSPKTVKATVSPANSTDGVIWTSSNEDICHVSQKGKITCKKAGSAIVTARTISEQIKQVNVICKNLPKYLNVQYGGKDTGLVNVKKGKSVKLKSVVDGGRTDVKVKWSSSNKNVAAVSSTGKVTAKKKGTCTITCRTEVGSLKKTVKIKVK